MYRRKLTDEFSEVFSTTPAANQAPAAHTKKKSAISTCGHATGRLSMLLCLQTLQHDYSAPGTVHALSIRFLTVLSDLESASAPDNSCAAQYSAALW